MQAGHYMMSLPLLDSPLLPTLPPSQRSYGEGGTPGLGLCLGLGQLWLMQSPTQSVRSWKPRQVNQLMGFRVLLKAQSMILRKGMGIC